MNKWLSVVSFLLLPSLAAPAHGGIQTPVTQQLHLVVSNYLTAWQQGDYKSMYTLWDSRSRQAVTLTELSHFFAVSLAGNDPKLVEARKLLNGSDQLIRGKIASVVSVDVHPETADYATADCTVQTTFSSLNGVAYAALFPELIKQAKALDAQTNHGNAAFAVAMLALEADKPMNVSTLNNSFGAYIHGMDAEDQQGPFITLYVHRYTLVREEGQWHISNAVTISNEAPVDQ